MITNELPLGFPIYDKREKQNRYRANCYGSDRGLLSPTDVLLPFQFRVTPGSAPTIASWVLNNVNTGAVINLTAQAALITIQAHAGGYNIYYNGDALASALSCGIYEMVITLSTGEIVYSELFNVTGYTSGNMPFMRISWANYCAVNNIFYAAGTGAIIQTELGDDILTEDDNPFLIEDDAAGSVAFANVVYLDSFLSHSDPELVEVVEKDGLGGENVVFSKMINRMKFSEVVPDFLKTAFMAIPLHKVIKVLTKSGTHDITVSRFKITSNAEASGCFSFVDITLEMDAVLYQDACCS